MKYLFIYYTLCVCMCVQRSNIQTIIINLEKFSVSILNLLYMYTIVTNMLLLLYTLPAIVFRLRLAVEERIKLPNANTRAATFAAAVNIINKYNNRSYIIVLNNYIKISYKICKPIMCIYVRYTRIPLSGRFWVTRFLNNNNSITASNRRRAHRKPVMVVRARPEYKL